MVYIQLSGFAVLLLLGSAEAQLLLNLFPEIPQQPILLPQLPLPPLAEPQFVQLPSIQTLATQAPPIQRIEDVPNPDLEPGVFPVPDPRSWPIGPDWNDPLNTWEGVRGWTSEKKSATPSPL